MTEINNNVLSEAKSRKGIKADCFRRFGPEGLRQLEQLFAKWDRLIANCKNDVERKHIKTMACVDIYQSMGYSHGLTVSGKVIIPDDENNNA